jgi:hypothetical protein
MSIESRIKETEDLLSELKLEEYRRKTVNLEAEKLTVDFWQSNPVQTPIDLEKENLIRKFTSDLYQTVDIECRQMLKVFDFAEDFISKMKEEKQ